MNRIVEKKILAPEVKLFAIETSEIAKKARAGQFIIVRIAEGGERIPLTIADFDREKGIITIVVKEVGKTTIQLGRLEVGDEILNVIGPLGRPSHIEKYGTVVTVGGGIGIAPIYPIAKAMKEAGNKVISIIGSRNKELLFWEEEMRATSDELYVTTDDGSYGTRGFVTVELTRLIETGSKIDLVTAIGRVRMMRAVSKVTKPYKIKTIVSLNPIMIDATGMCGGCRVTVGNETKFTCVDGPEFDGHQVDFDELMSRQNFYREEEKVALKKCRLLG